MSLRQALLRKVLHVIVLEATLLAFGFWAGLLSGMSDAFSFAGTVLAVYAAVNLISWQLDKKDAGVINRLLKDLQENKK